MKRSLINESIFVFLRLSHLSNSFFLLFRFGPALILSAVDSGQVALAETVEPSCPLERRPKVKFKDFQLTSQLIRGPSAKQKNVKNGAFLGTGVKLSDLCS